MEQLVREARELDEEAEVKWEGVVLRKERAGLQSISLHGWTLFHRSTHIATDEAVEE